MFGGGLRQALTTEIGTVDDSVVDICTTFHPSGVLPAIGVDTKVQNIWTGIIGFSGRRQGIGEELVAAGYTGDGMCTAWGAAEEPVAMILGVEDGAGVIEEMNVTFERVERAEGLEGLVGIFFG